jgi:rhodanese-related sulfurtransferase
MRVGKIFQILALSGVLAGYVAWAHRPSRPTPLAAQVADSKIPLVRLAEAEALWRRSSTVFVDARSTADYAYGHIRGAVSLPLEEFNERFPALENRLRRAETIVVYCKNQNCAKSLWTWIELRNHGLTQARIYPDGWYEWSDHGKPSDRTSAR